MNETSISIVVTFEARVARSPASSVLLPPDQSEARMSAAETVLVHVVYCLPLTPPNCGQTTPVATDLGSCILLLASAAARRLAKGA